MHLPLSPPYCQDHKYVWSFCCQQRPSEAFGTGTGRKEKRGRQISHMDCHESHKECVHVHSSKELKCDALIVVKMLISNYVISHTNSTYRKVKWHSNCHLTIKMCMTKSWHLMTIWLNYLIWNSTYCMNHSIWCCIRLMHFSLFYSINKSRGVCFGSYGSYQLLHISTRHQHLSPKIYTFQACIRRRGHRHTHRGGGGGTPGFPALTLWVSDRDHFNQSRDMHDKTDKEL